MSKFIWPSNTTPISFNLKKNTKTVSLTHLYSYLKATCFGSHIYHHHYRRQRDKFHLSYHFITFQIKNENVWLIVKCGRKPTRCNSQMFIINTFSTCFGHHYAHLQETKDRVLLHVVCCAGSAGCGW